MNGGLVNVFNLSMHPRSTLPLQCSTRLRAFVILDLSEKNSLELRTQSNTEPLFLKANPLKQADNEVIQIKTTCISLDIKRNPSVFSSTDLVITLHLPQPV